VYGQVEEYRFNVQLAFSLGAPVNSLGVNIIGEYFGQEEVEIAIGYGVAYNFDNYGPSISHFEHRILGSVHYLWGDKEYVKKDMPYMRYIDSQNAGNSFGYSWERFFNKIHTSQNVGTVHFRLENMVMQFSNDVFANSNGKDRFRTGAFGVGYIEENVFYNTKLLFWAGDSHCKGVKKVRDSDFPARWGYRDISDCLYGDISHGIWSIGVNVGTRYNQVLGAQLGVDREQIRNVVQNKIFHDLYFIPRAINKTKNLHLPMKTVDGENFLYKEGQKIRPSKFVWQISGNPSPLF